MSDARGLCSRVRASVAALYREYIFPLSPDSSACPRVVVVLFNQITVGSGYVRDVAEIIPSDVVQSAASRCRCLS